MVEPAKGHGLTREITAGLEQLPFYERAAVFHRDVRRLPLRAVADQLGCSLPAARLQLANGRIKLLRRIKGR